MTSFSRRRFLQLTASSLLVAPLARAVEPFQRGGSPRMPLSLAAYSFREFFKDQRGKVNPEGKLDMLAFVNYCADHGWPGAELTSYFFPSALTDEYLLEVRRQAYLRGVAITGTAVGNNFALPQGAERDAQIADVKKWVDHAALLGAPHIRVFAGAAKGIDPAEARKLCVAALDECADYAGKRGIFLGLENHGGIVARPEELLEIVHAVKSRWLGVNLDTGNFHTADPYAGLALCAPYAVNVQVKVEIKREGREKEPADLPRLAKILRDANYQGWVVLEYEAKEDPWKAVPPLLVQMRELFADQPARAAAGGEWKPIFDGKTLNGWKAPDFSGQGDVEIKDGQMILGMGDDITGMNFAGDHPKMNYEVALEAARLQGSDFFCGLTLPYGDKACTLVVGGWGGALVGLSSINGDDASENETTSFMKFEQGKWYRIRVKMTPEKIEAWIDDEQVVNVETEGKTIDMRAGEIELSRPFGIAAFRSQAGLRDIKLRRL